MIAQYIKEQGIQEGIQEAMQQGNMRLLSRQISKKYHVGTDKAVDLLDGLSVDDLLELGEYMLDCDSVDDVTQWIWQRRQNPANN